MDTSTKYVNICQKAKEIQAMRTRPEPFDNEDAEYTSFFWLPKASKVVILKWDNDESHPILGSYGDSEDGAVWLPRQDQLQAMVAKETPHLLALYFSVFCRPMANKRAHGTIAINDDGEPYTAVTYETLNQAEMDYPLQFTSMEQLWLAFVMKEKYGKRWVNDEEWV